MSELGIIAGFASQFEKLGIIGVLVVFIIYFVYQHQTINKQMIKALEGLKEQTKELYNLSKQQQEFQTKFLSDLRDDIKDIKEKTSDMHLHCKESVNLIRNKH
ncbi:Uncharacterised protein [Campylobacter hyointestinalis subsp. hyointestinalis]|uniref:Uncharacterized protein n=1 Tax=Campylobacter hyointestinalis subsp. hyointestinalis TaxID=91352 RepID=A0A0S4RAX6_CAMHY|nr:hypothetical protein [Campylobacter hyointestinalis]CUU71039.1 Uncharacterised protein [Campylobacter hyointestinalis subsp. hyointestinalis]